MAQTKEVEKIPEISEDPRFMSQAQELAEYVENISDLQANFGEVVSWDDLEVSYQVVKEKERLEGIPLVLLAWRFNASKAFKDAHGLPAEFVSVLAATYDIASGKILQKFIFNDSAKIGVYSQLNKVSQKKNRYGNVIAERGLKRLPDYRYQQLDNGSVIAEGADVPEGTKVIGSGVGVAYALA